MSEPMRIQRALARSGVLSRRKAEELVANGRVTVNGMPAKVGQSVDPANDVIKVDGERIAAPGPLEWFVLHKPSGVITSRHDPEGRRTVFDLVPARPGLTYVGRLDFLTEGVLLLTGTVDSRETKRLAENICHECSGIIDIHNQIRIVANAKSERKRS